MKIEVFNLNKILKAVEKGHVENLISIRDRYCDEGTMEKYACLDRRAARYGVNMKVIYFDDIDRYRFKHHLESPWIEAKFADGSKEPIFFDETIAKDIVEWVRGLFDEDRDVSLTVHCWAGKSRSQAVAYWLNTYFNLIQQHDVDEYIANNINNIWEKVHFNCDVLKVLTETYG